MEVLSDPSNLSIKLPFWFEIEIACYSIYFFPNSTKPLHSAVVAYAYI